MELVPGNDHVPSTSPGVKLTYEDYLLLPDDGLRHELLDGEHYVTPSPSVKHQQILLNLTLILGNWLAANPVGRILFAPFDVVLSLFDVVVPDLIYFSRERAARLLDLGKLAGAPELAVEIASPGTRQRDETTKRRLYERFGVTEYWVVDPELDVVRVYRRGAGGFTRPIEISAEEEDVLTTPLLTGLRVPLRDLFRT